MARRKESPQEAVVREMMRGHRIPYEGALREISPPLRVYYSSSVNGIYRLRYFGVME